MPFTDIFLLEGLLFGTWGFGHKPSWRQLVILLEFRDLSTLIFPIFHNIYWMQHAISQMLQKIGIYLYRIQ